MSVLRPRVSRMTGLSAAAAVMAVGLMPAAPALAVTGPEAAAGKYPYAVQLTIGDEANSRACTGSLVNHVGVLTAASCFAGTPGTPVPAGQTPRKNTANRANGPTHHVPDIEPPVEPR
ncbi:trypsin-like serine protease, partial [Streptomyces goshikiensis]